MPDLYGAKSLNDRKRRPFVGFDSIVSCWIWPISASNLFTKLFKTYFLLKYSLQKVSHISCNAISIPAMHD